MQQNSGDRAETAGIFAKDFFYRNLRIQEYLSAIRYGVEARRGLILLIGAAGVGKTTLLSNAVAGLPEHVACFTVAGENLGFADVLRRIHGVGNPDESAEMDEAALVRNARSILRARLERSELTVLAIDDAHLLPERTLRKLIHNFLGGSAEAPDASLLQFILAGNPSVKQKLAQAALLPLRRRRPLVCEIAPLSSQEVGAYIENGLQSADRPVDSFDERAVKRIALLSEGNPRSIELLCDHALRRQRAGDQVTAEIIDSAAQSLNMRGRAPATPSASEDAFILADKAEHPGIWGNARHEMESAVPPAQPEFFGARREEGGFFRNFNGARLGFWVRVFTVSTVVIAAAALIPAQPAFTLFDQWRGKLAEFTADRFETVFSAQKTVDSEPAPSSPSEPTSRPASPARIEGPDRPQESDQKTLPDQDIPPKPQIARPNAADSGEWDQAEADKKSARTNAPPRAVSKETGHGNRDLQAEVARAIASRAIMGVEVSVVQGIAILDGSVASERQRRAAERAALSVSGVERVRNRITVNYG